MSRTWVSVCIKYVPRIITINVFYQFDYTFILEVHKYIFSQRHTYVLPFSFHLFFNNIEIKDYVRLGSELDDFEFTDECLNLKPLAKEFDTNDDKASRSNTETALLVDTVNQEFNAELLVDNQYLDEKDEVNEKDGRKG